MSTGGSSIVAGTVEVGVPAVVDVAILTSTRRGSLRVRSKSTSARADCLRLPTTTG